MGNDIDLVFRNVKHRLQQLRGVLAHDDESVGEQCDFFHHGALIRVGETGALGVSRELALDYARQARACLDGNVRRDELEALTDAVVDRES